jgi:small subunit ribosomal protein S17
MAEEEEKTQDTEEPAEESEEQAEEAAPEAEAPAEEAAEAPAEEPAAEEPEAEATTDDASTEDSAAEAPPAAPGSGAEGAAGSDDDDLDWKTRQRLERSRRPAEARPQLSPTDRQDERRRRREATAAGRQRHRRTRRGKRGEQGTGTPPAERHPNPAKVRQGIVVSDRGDKTITVRIDIARRHPTYEKVVRRSRTLHAHDERNEAGEGDVVRVVETRPLSKSKRWRLVDVVEKAR